MVQIWEIVKFNIWVIWVAFGAMIGWKTDGGGLKLRGLRLTIIVVLSYFVMLRVSKERENPITGDVLKLRGLK